MGYMSHYAMPPEKEAIKSPSGTLLQNEISKISEYVLTANIILNTLRLSRYRIVMTSYILRVRIEYIQITANSI